jgi:isopentenyl diphosphate isomerase/L-lactate dehydrogenase-like FMN-dependent dehydrogenase
VLKALALGATAVMIGRPVIWGLTLDGAQGVEQVLDMLESELKIAMALSGCPSIRHITKDIIIQHSSNL